MAWIVIRFLNTRQSAAPCRFSLPISPEFTEFQLLADGDIIIDLDISLL